MSGKKQTKTHYNFFTISTILRELKDEGLNVSETTFYRLEDEGLFLSDKTAAGWRRYNRQEVNLIKALIKENYGYE